MLAKHKSMKPSAGVLFPCNIVACKVDGKAPATALCSLLPSTEQDFSCAECSPQPLIITIIDEKLKKSTKNTRGK